MKKIQTKKAPLPAGHYSQAIVHQGLVFVSGQLPIDPATGKLMDGGIEVQFPQVIANISAILKEAGSDLNHILKATIYISDMALWPEVNRLYAYALGEHKPARAVIPCGDLHHGVLLEMEVVAALNE